MTDQSQPLVGQIVQIRERSSSDISPLGGAMGMQSSAEVQAKKVYY